MDQRSRWIWIDQDEQMDQYGEFADRFSGGGALKMRISADSNYAVYCNGALTFSGQYPDFPHDKVFDEVDITPFCRAGENRLGVVVWHYGKGNMSYFPSRAALRYEIWRDGELICASGAHTLSRQSRAYCSGLQKIITGQLGFSFRYDLCREDGWMTGEAEGFAPSRIVEQHLPMRLRPCKRPVVGALVPTRIVQSEGDTHFLIDLGREYAGFLTLCAESAVEQDLLISYGEHIADGGVRRKIGSRDFSVEVRLRAGENEYVNPFRRLGLRYLEIFAQAPLQIGQISVLPVEYPLAGGKVLPPMDREQRRIYDTCVRTLKMCMHEHYEDTPWREQALYAMDGRNQMLCGYYAFGETEFARANLLLMSRDRRADDLLSICTPSSDDLTIPSFSLHYFTEIWEYTLHSGDKTLAREVFPKLKRLLAAFTRRLEDGCIPVFTEKCHWNFYEWSRGLSGKLFCAEEKRFDAALNFLLVMALRAMRSIAAAIGEPDEYGALAEDICRAAHSRFYDPARGLFVNSTADPDASELVNALAILCGAAQPDEARRIAQILAQGESGLTPATLSMLCFKYDALLLADRRRYRSVILQEIAEKYGRMLSQGATTFWETEQGESDFDRAGSLCHGWSAMPVYYYHILLGEET